MLIGLVGKPNSGKSSFFKAATMVDVKISNVPFTTIKPNVGIAYIIMDCVEKGFGKKCNPKNGFCRNGRRFVPIRLIDVAGLVPGAHEGRGMGNQFLDDLRQASVLIHTVDFSGKTDSEGNPTENHDPKKDVEFLENEIDYWFASVIEKNLPKILKAKTKTDLVQNIQEQLSGLEIDKKFIERAVEKFSPSQTLEFARELRKLSKPILICANKIDLKSAQENFEKLKSIFQNAVPTSADSEIALKLAVEKNLINYFPGNGFEISGRLEEKQKQALEKIKTEVIEKFGSTGVQKCLDKAIFDLLNYIAVCPVEDENKLTDSKGNVLPDIHLIPRGSTALDLAFKIHTEIGEKFISAIDARTKRRLGKDYVLQNNDVIKIITSK